MTYRNPTIAGESRILNSYSLGNVSVDRRGFDSNGYGFPDRRATYAGGLVGWMRNCQDTWIQYCFASTVEVFAETVPPAVYAGGILAFMGISNDSTGHLYNNAALGASVTAMGKTAAALNANRIYSGFDGRNNLYQITSNWMFESDQNYARDTMRVEKGSDTTTFFPFWDGTGAEPASYYHYPNGSESDKHGENASGSIFQNQHIWTGLLEFNSNGSDAWDFSTISRGYPRLRNVGGQ